MEMYRTNRLYKIGDNNIDEFGVDHSNFSLRDELEYNQKIADNQQNRNPWGTNNFNNTGTQYAQNNYSNTANDGTMVNNQNTWQSDEDLYNTTWNNVKNFEEIIQHSYIDTAGKITVGVGNNIDNWNDFKNVNFTIDGIPATEQQKLDAYNKLHQFANEKGVDGNFINRNYQAPYFKNMTDLRITNDEAYNLSLDHIKNDLEYLREQFTDFDTYPRQLQEVLLDLQYNTGNVNKNTWPRLIDGIARKDINYVADNVHRANIGDDRNKWARDMILSISNW